MAMMLLASLASSGPRRGSDPSQSCWIPHPTITTWQSASGLHRYLPIHRAVIPAWPDWLAGAHRRSVVRPSFSFSRRLSLRRVANDLAAEEPGRSLFSHEELPRPCCSCSAMYLARTCKQWSRHVSAGGHLGSPMRRFCAGTQDQSWRACLIPLVGRGTAEHGFGLG